MQEILVHNLSHSDLVLGVQFPDGSSSVARPKFSCFRAISESIYTSATKWVCELAQVPPYSRIKSRYLHECKQIPVGYDFSDHAVNIASTGSLRFRSEDLQHISQECVNVNVSAVYFPLIATLIPKWLKVTGDSSSPNSKRLIVLVSGRGQPQDERATHSDNSTKYTAKLIEMFIKRAYSNIDVELVHSRTNLFRYDENIVFVKTELLPAMNKHRDKLVQHYGALWKDHMRITLSFADGSTARISAINASLRHFRPSYMHFWVLKTFWRERKLCEDDIEWHSFQEIATDSAVSLCDINDPLVGLAVKEMENFRKTFAEAAAQQESDLMSFWLRKTKKPVLAVLLVQKPGQPPKLYRGTNMEVSMPTGSLCAERNVIGTALADDVGLMRHHIKLIVVYSVNGQACLSNAAISHQSLDTKQQLRQQEQGQLSPVPNPCQPLTLKLPQPPSLSLSSSSSPAATAAPEVSSSFSLSLAVSSPSSAHTATAPALQLDEGCSAVSSSLVTADAMVSSPTNGVPKSPTITQRRTILNMRSTSITSHPSVDEIANDSDEDLPTRKRSRKSLASIGLDSEHTVSQHARQISVPFYHHPPTMEQQSHPKSSSAAFVPIMTTITVDESDMNPLKPCGACNEWLKKIAEVNPQMQVITFTDAMCHGIYCEPVGEY